MVLVFICPHCGNELIILENEINCRIFRHAVYKNWEPVNPHAGKELCDKLVAEDKVLGCCKPFELIKSKSGEWEIKACEYK